MSSFVGVKDDLKAKIAAAFAAVYLIWGSTYLAIRFAIETMPPFFMAGTRFVLAGLILYVWTRMRGSSQTTLAHWRSAVIVGGLMLLGGHGAVVWAEQWVPSGLVSLLISTVPLWMVCMDWLQHGSQPDFRIAVGLILGFVGIILLVTSLENLGTGYIDIIGALVVVFGAFLWASGSLYSRSIRLPVSPLLMTALQMIAGGLLLLVASLVTGEWTRVQLDQVSTRSLFSWVYLVVFGALIAFTSYVWLLKVSTPARVSTYAYVNPIVALFLGWVLADETPTFMNILAAAIILGSVVIITTHRPKRKF
jgi:drug/metabolite transporter (DMT)-like permease